MKKVLRTLLIPLFFLFIASECKKEEITQLPEDTSTISLNAIEENTECLQTPVNGTLWYLIGFVDENTQKIKLANRTRCIRCLNMSFLDNQINVFSYSNSLHATYQLDSINNNIFIEPLGGTKVAEPSDFRDALQSAKRYVRTSKGLCIYYENNKYLLFKPRDVFINNMPLNSIYDNPNYLSLSLDKTSWRLIGFVDEARQKIKLALPAPQICPICYTLEFDSKNIKGYSTSNSFTISYKIDGQNILLSDFTTTETVEDGEGKEFMEKLALSSKYKITVKGLCLYYDNNNFLLFQPQQIKRK